MTIAPVHVRDVPPATSSSLDTVSAPAARIMGRRRRWWLWARILGGLGILTVVVWRLGTGPFVHGLRMVNGWSVAAAAAIALLTTMCCAWRWSLVARGLGVGLPLRAAIAAYYRSQFLNTMLPGGILGDVHRAVRHGRDVGDVSRSLRAVAAERVAGQVVQVVVTTIAPLVLPSPARSLMPVIATVLVVGSVDRAKAWPPGCSRRPAWARASRGSRRRVRRDVAGRVSAGCRGSRCRPPAPGVETAVVAACRRTGRCCSWLIVRTQC